MRTVVPRLPSRLQQTLDTTWASFKLPGTACNRLEQSRSGRAQPFRAVAVLENAARWECRNTR
eukprot:9133043-Alexandrium_andersonii.AAC.1